MYPSRRTKYRIHAKVAVTSTSVHNFFTGFTENISEGGVFVATYQLLPVGTELNLMLKLDGGDEVPVRGEVRWLRDLHADDTSGVMPGMGVRFVDLDADLENAIQRFIDSQRDTLFYDDIEL
jgi:uncharacterized protein (TIGR02266 family)